MGRKCVLLSFIYLQGWVPLMRSFMKGCCTLFLSLSFSLSLSLSLSLSCAHAHYPYILMISKHACLCIWIQNAFSYVQNRLPRRTYTNQSTGHNARTSETRRPFLVIVHDIILDSFFHLTIYHLSVVVDNNLDDNFSRYPKGQDLEKDCIVISFSIICVIMNQKNAFL